jgi:hypothetical protein
VILDEGQQFSAPLPEEQAVYECLQVIIRETVREMARHAVEWQILRFIREHLRKKQPVDPLRLLTDDLVAEVIADLALGLTEVSTRPKAQRLRGPSGWGGLLKRSRLPLPPQEAVLECSYAYLLERRSLDVWNMLLDEVVEPQSEALTREVYQDEAYKKAADDLMGTPAPVGSPACGASVSHFLRCAQLRWWWSSSGTWWAG